MDVPEYQSVPSLPSPPALPLPAQAKRPGAPDPAAARARPARGPAGLGPLSPSMIGASMLGSGLPGVPRSRRVESLSTDPVITDALWELIEPLIPAKTRRRRHPGRKPLDDRTVLTGILVVLGRGIGFERLPGELGYGSGMTCWRRLRDWQQAGVWPAICTILARSLPEGGRIDFDRVSIAMDMPDAPVTRRPAPTRAKQPSAVAAEFGMTLLR